MFYAQSFLTRKGPLGPIWLAAFSLRRLRRDQICATDIASSVDKILPDLQISYRILAQLLLGIVRIFSKKVDMLFDECNEALSVIRKSFQSSQLISPGRSENKGKKEKVHGSAPAITVNFKLTDHPDVQLPNRFELDSFDLEITDDQLTFICNSEKAVHQDNRTDAQTYLLPCNEHEQCMIGTSEFDRVCFTPLHEVFSQDMIADLDRQIDELCGFSQNRNELAGNDPDIDERDYSSGHRAKRSLAQDFANLGHFGVPNLTSSAECQEHAAEGEQGKADDENVPSTIEPMEVLVREHNFDKSFLPNVTVDSTVDVSKLQCDGGLISTNFVVSTPPKREGRKPNRKRKVLYDTTIVLSNKVLRQAMHNSSSLICRRKQAPSTSLDAWRARTRHNFLEALIPCMPSELLCPFSHSERSKRKNNALQESVESEVTREDGLDEVRAETSVKQTNCVREPEEYFEPRTSEYDTLRSSGAWKADWEHLNGSLTAENIEYSSNIFSQRTRAVGEFLHKRFTEMENRLAKSLRLGEVLEGKTRKTSSRFFYETLMLKGHGMIDVKQEVPYQDILISPQPQLGEAFSMV